MEFFGVLICARLSATVRDLGTNKLA